MNKNLLKNFINNQTQDTNTINIPVDENKLTIKVQNKLDFESFTKAVETATRLCFDDTTTPSTYHSERKELAFKSVVVTAYTDIDTADLTLKELYTFVNSSAYCKIEKEIDSTDLTNLKTAIEQQIQYEIKTVTKEYNKVFEDTIADFKEVLDKLGALSNISTEQINNILNTIQNTPQEKIIDYMRRTTNEQS